MKLEEQIKRIKQMMLTEAGAEPRKSSGGGGGTSTSSSGSFEGNAFEAGGIFNNDGRKPDMGELPKVVDITGGDSEEITVSVDDLFGTDPSVDVIDIIDSLVGPTGPRGDDDGPGGPYDPHGDDDGPGGPRGGGDYDDDDGGGSNDDDDYDPDPDPHGPVKEPDNDEVKLDSLDYVPCCEPCGNGMWKRCNTDDCVYSTISDCELRGDNNTYSESKKSRTTFND